MKESSVMLLKALCIMSTELEDLAVVLADNEEVA